MKKLLMIFGLILGLATITNANTAEAKVLTKKEVAKKIANSAKKAYKTKKNVTVTFQIKKSDIESANFYDYIAKAEWGSYAIGEPSTEKLDCDYCNYTIPSNEFPKRSVDWKVKKGVYTVKEKIRYSEVKKSYEQFPYFKKICDHLEKVGKSMGPVEKAAYLDYWLGSRLGYHLASEEGKDDIYYFATPKRIWQGKAFGQCEVRADLYARFAKIMGVKHVATVYIKKINHLASAVRFQDGRIFWFDLGFIRNGKWITQENIDRANQYRIENNLDIPEWTFESYLYDDFVSHDEMSRDETDCGKVVFNWVGEGKDGGALVEYFTAKQYTKGPIYSKFDW